MSSLVESESRATTTVAPTVVPVEQGMLANEAHAASVAAATRGSDRSANDLGKGVGAVATACGASEAPSVMQRILGIGGGGGAKAAAPAVTRPAHSVSYTHLTLPTIYSV